MYSRLRYKTDLHHIVEKGSVEEVEAVVKAGVDVNEKWDHDTCATFIQVVHNFHKVTSDVKQLRDSNCRAETPLHRAVGAGRVNIVKVLLKLGADVNARDIHGSVPLHRAALVGCAPVLKELVHNGAELDARDHWGHTALCLAARCGHLDVVTELLTNGANLEARDTEGYTPLILAAVCQHLGVVQELMSNGADLEARTQWGYTALSLVAAEGNFDVVKKLVLCGAELDVRDYSSFTPLIRSARHGYLHDVHALVYLGAELEARDSEGCTSLIHAAKSTNTDIIERLVHLGAELEARDNDGKTALHHAAETNLRNVQALLDLGADSNSITTDGFSLLHTAVSENSWDVVSFLIKKGGDINSTLPDGRTLLMLCEEPNFSILSDNETYLNQQDHAGNTFLMNNRFATKENLPQREAIMKLLAGQLMMTDLWKRTLLYHITYGHFVYDKHVLQDMLVSSGESFPTLFHTTDINGWNVLHWIALYVRDDYNPQYHHILQSNTWFVKDGFHISAKDKFGRTPVDLLSLRFAHKEDNYFTNRVTIYTLLNNIQSIPPHEETLELLSVDSWHPTSQHPDTIKLIRHFIEDTHKTSR